MPRESSPWSLLLALSLGLAPGSAAASGLNVESLRLNPEDNGLSGSFDVGLDFQAGNVNRLDFGTEASLAYRRKRHLVFLIGSSKYATRTRAVDGGSLSGLLAPDARFINKASVHLRYNYEFLPWLAGEVFNQVQHNEFLLVESRVLGGIGPRFVPYNNGEFALALGLAYMLEYEALASERVVRPLPPRTLVHRASSYLTLFVNANERISMRSTTYVQPRFDLFSDLRLLSEGEIGVVLVEPVTINLLLRVRWDTQPSVYCSEAIGVHGCPSGSEVRLRELDIGVQNSISVSF